MNIYKRRNTKVGESLIQLILCIKFEQDTRLPSDWKLVECQKKYFIPPEGRLNKQKDKAIGTEILEKYMLIVCIIF